MNNDSNNADVPPINEEDVAAIQEAIDDIERGDKGIPFEEFDREFRARHKLPPADHKRRNPR